MHFNFFSFMSSLKSHFGVLRDHFLALLAQRDADEDVIDKVTNQLAEEVLAKIEQTDSLGGVFETLNQCLVWMKPADSGRRKGRGDGQGSDEEVESESDSDEESFQQKVHDVIVSVYCERNFLNFEAWYPPEKACPNESQTCPSRS